MPSLDPLPPPSVDVYVAIPSVILIKTILVNVAKSTYKNYNVYLLIIEENISMSHYLQVFSNNVIWNSIYCRKNFIVFKDVLHVQK